MLDADVVGVDNVNNDMHVLATEGAENQIVGRSSEGLNAGPHFTQNTILEGGMQPTSVFSSLNRDSNHSQSLHFSPINGQHAEERRRHSQSNVFSLMEGQQFVNNQSFFHNSHINFMFPEAIQTAEQLSPGGRPGFDAQMTRCKCDPSFSISEF